MKTIDLGSVAATVSGNVVNYTSGSYRYVLRFPAKPALCSITELRDGRSTVTFSSYKGAVLSITGRSTIINAIFETAGGQRAS